MIPEISLVKFIQQQIQTTLKDPHLKNSLVFYRGILARIQTDNFHRYKTDDIPDEKALISIKSLYNEAKTAYEITETESKKHGVDATTALQKLKQEIEAYEPFLPKVLSDGFKIEELLLEDKTVIQDIVQAKNDGMATGIAMKYFKTKNIAVDGNVVKTKIQEIRSADAK